MVLNEKLVAVLTTSRALYMLQAAQQMLIHKHGKRQSGGKFAFIQMPDCDPVCLHEVLRHLTSKQEKSLEYLLEAEAAFHRNQSNLLSLEAEEQVAHWAASWTKALTTASHSLMKDNVGKKIMELDFMQCLKALPPASEVFGRKPQLCQTPANVKAESNGAVPAAVAATEQSDKMASSAGKSPPSTTPSFADILVLNEVTQAEKVADDDLAKEKLNKLGLRVGDVLCVQKELEKMFLQKAVFLATAMMFNDVGLFLDSAWSSHC